MAASAKVVWSEPALSDVNDIAEWIAVDSPAAARKVVQRLFAATERVALFPRSGRRVPELPNHAYREVISSPFRVIYRIDGARVLIVHVVRGERLLNLGRLR